MLVALYSLTLADPAVVDGREALGAKVGPPRDAYEEVDRAEQGLRTSSIPSR